MKTWHYIFFLLGILVGTLHADEVTIEWNKSAGISAYLLQVQHENKTVFSQKFPPTATSWKGRLPYGLYSYRLRVYNSRNAAGPWSEPVAFLVTPPAPQLVLPSNDSTILLEPGMPAEFRWSPVSGIQEFAVEVRGKNGFLKRKIVKGTTAKISGLSHGEFVWSVKPVLTGKDASQAQVIDAKESPKWKIRFDTGEGDQEDGSPTFLTWLRARDPKKAFPIGASVCVFSKHFMASTARVKAQALACGTVKANGTEPEVFGVELAANKRLNRDETYFVVKESDVQRAPASAGFQEEYEVYTKEEGRRFDIGLGVIAGAHYYLPSMQLAYAFEDRWALGLTSVIAHQSDADAEASLLGFLATLDYFFDPSYYSGFFGEAGVGPYVFSAQNGTQTEGSRFSFAALLAGGYQWHPATRSGFNLKFTLGCQAIASPQLTLVQTSLSGVLPFVSVGAGFAF